MRPEMHTFTEFPVSGSVMTIMDVYTRKGSPSVFAPAAGELCAGSCVVIQGAVVGDAVEGNAHWYRIDEETFIWEGACTRLEPYPAFPQTTRTHWTAIVLHER